MNSEHKVQYCGNCTIPTEYCSFNDKKIYKNCLKSLAKTNPIKAEQLVSNTTAPIIQIAKCGISRLNGTYKQLSKSQPFQYINECRPTISIIRSDIKPLSLTKVWIIMEQSCVNSDFMIHHYLNSSDSHALYPPLKQWKSIAGIHPLPSVKHFEFNPKKHKPLRKLSTAEQSLQKLWKAYPKIANLMHAGLTDAGLSNDSVTWVGTEKIHGANMSFITEGTQVLSAKRSSILRSNDGFYRGWELIVASEKANVLNCFKHIQSNVDPSVTAIIVYGELFGGSYSAFDGKMEEKTKEKFVRIQKGIDYSPKHHFYPFDILVMDERRSYFLEYAQLMSVLPKSGFQLYATAVIEGSLQQIMGTFEPNLFETTIPQRLKLEKPKRNCIAEGIVLRRKNGKRVCLKYKCDKFGEIELGNAQTRLKRNVSLPTSLKDIETNVLQNVFGGNDSGNIIGFIYKCVNENRLNSVSSKIGTINPENYNKIIGTFTADVWNEIALLKADKLKLIQNQNDLRAIKKFITECIRQFVSDFMSES